MISSKSYAIKTKGVFFRSTAQTLLTSMLILVLEENNLNLINNLKE